MSNEQYGIGYLSVVPLRASASDKSEMVSQLLFGEVYKVIATSENQKWKQIQCEADKYEGWLDFKQFKSISYDYYQQYIQAGNHLITRQGITIIAFDNHSVPIVGGSVLPFFNEETNSIDLDFAQIDILEQVLPPLQECTFGDELLEYIYSFLGAPYLWGGRTFFGIDCSGFVQQIYRQLNIMLPRDASQQQLVGSEVTLDAAKIGDLAFFINDKSKVTHVGIILDNHQIIHASGEVRIDMLAEKGIYVKESDSYSHQLASIKRIL